MGATEGRVLSEVPAQLKAPMAETPGGDPPGDIDALYRQYLADLILDFATNGGQVDTPEAHRRIMSVTHRTITTVKNWLAYRVNFPDIGSLARIVAHWEIPPADIFPRGLDGLLSGVTPVSEPDPKTRGINDEHIVPVHSSSDPARLDRLLLKYTDHPRECVYVRQDGSDMLDQIRPGELMLIDPSYEHIRANGVYLLKFMMPDAPDRLVTRNVEILLSEPALRISCGSGVQQSVETISLANGNLPSKVTVLGKVIGVLKQA